MKFNEMKLSEKTVSALEKMGYLEPTEVQSKAIPDVISGHNLIVRSQTGTGKTAAFGIGILERLHAKSSRRALILAPTRELAVQVGKEIAEIGSQHNYKVCVAYGGASINVQMDELSGGNDILVATPGRLLDLNRRGAVDIHDFDIVVLDEADQMLDLGFRDEVTEILDKLPPKRLTMLFSATVDEGITSIASKYVPHAKMIEIGELAVVSSITEEFIEATDLEKFPKLVEALRKHPDVKTLIFRETKIGAAKIQERLWNKGIKAGLLQGDMSQAKRTRVMDDFKHGRIKILVATNVAARGLHVENLDLIINYDAAQSDEIHLHRVGRTGRMGAEGKAINFVRRKESRDERMGHEHPDFAWMRGGNVYEQSQRSERPSYGRDRPYNDRRGPPRPSRYGPNEYGADQEERRGYGHASRGPPRSGPSRYGAPRSGPPRQAVGERRPPSHEGPHEAQHHETRAREGTTHHEGAHETRPQHEGAPGEAPHHRKRLRQGHY